MDFALTHQDNRTYKMQSGGELSIEAEPFSSEQVKIFFKEAGKIIVELTLSKKEATCIINALNVVDSECKCIITM